MKLVRFGKPGREKPGLILADGRKIDASGFGQDYDEDFFADDGLAKLAVWMKNYAGDAPEIPADARPGPPIKRPGKIVCIGLNYRKHAKEAGLDVPKEPVIFFKATSAIVGPNDNLKIPRNSSKTDWEVELAVVIGKRASYVAEKEAMDYVAGYLLHNDYSEREFQIERGGQWVKGKSCDTFAPLGPFMATSDEIANPQKLEMWLKVNGETLQKSSTSDMVFEVKTLISYVSQFMSLLPGDIISTGTPEGVGLGLKPPRYLKAGDRIELGIDGLGMQMQLAVR